MEIQQEYMTNLRLSLGGGWHRVAHRGSISVESSRTRIFIKDTLLTLRYSHSRIALPILYLDCRMCSCYRWTFEMSYLLESMYILTSCYHHFLCQETESLVLLP